MMKSEILISHFFEIHFHRWFRQFPVTAQHSTQGWQCHVIHGGASSSSRGPVLWQVIGGWQSSSHGTISCTLVGFPLHQASLCSQVWATNIEGPYFNFLLIIINTLCPLPLAVHVEVHIGERKGLFIWKQTGGMKGQSFNIGTKAC